MSPLPDDVVTSPGYLGPILESKIAVSNIKTVQTYNSKKGRFFIRNRTNIQLKKGRFFIKNLPFLSCMFVRFLIKNLPFFELYVCTVLILDTAILLSKMGPKYPGDVTTSSGNGLKGRVQPSSMSKIGRFYIKIQPLYKKSILKLYKHTTQKR